MNMEAALFESWQRHNMIIQKVAKAISENLFEAKATPTSPSVAIQFAEMHDTRFGFLQKIAPEFATKLPELLRWEDDGFVLLVDKKKILPALKKSEQAVLLMVQARSKIKKGKTIGLDGVYSHPVHFLQHMLWHEAYHMGQIMLALKVAGAPMSQEVQQKTVWKVWKS